MSRTQHVLVVDDDKDIRTLVARAIEKDGFRVSQAENGAGMRRALTERAIDLIVLDLMLPGKDGLTLCRELRAEKVTIPIIMLTAKGDDIDRIVGLELGADDYLAKPFNSRELLARIRAVLRRSGQQAPPPDASPHQYLCFAGWRLDTGKRVLLSRDDVVVSLSGSEFELLRVFVLRPQKVLSRDQLIDLTRGKAATLFDRSIDIQVSRLRRKLGDDPREPTMIKTVRGGGYIFAVDVTPQ